MVQSTYLGTDATGTANNLGNEEGLWIDNAGSNTIGSATLGNLISGNVTGVMISGANASKNVILGNLIGTDVTGANGLPNTGDGVQFSASSNTIGGTGTAANTIAYNTAYGVDAQSGTGDTITQNSIFNNQKSGIFLARRNNNQPAPGLTGASSIGGKTSVQGKLTGFAASTPYVLEFFASVATDPAGGDQAHVFLGSVTVTTDGTGSAQFTETLTVAADSGQRVTATATSPAGDTSIFAGSVKVANPFVVTTTQDNSSQPVLGSLRAAIINADANPGSTPDLIAFQIPTSDPGYDPTAQTWTIHLAGELDAIMVPVVLDGTTQGPKGYSGTPLIFLRPQAGTSISDGFVLGGNSQGSTIAGLNLSGFISDGILVSASQNTIGGTAAGEANVIKGTGAAGDRREHGHEESNPEQRDHERHPGNRVEERRQ